MSMMLKGTKTTEGTTAGRNFNLPNRSLGSAVESWTAIMQTLAQAQPEWWTNVTVDMSAYGTGTGSDGAGVVPVPVAAAAAAAAHGDEGESESEEWVSLQHSSSPGTAQDETVHGTGEIRPLSGNDDDDDTDDGL
jgi:hypothetical protein